MHKEGYYSSGEFAKKANVTVRTIRYYDKQNILKPSLLTEDGVRFYTDSDFTRLQQILLFKYLDRKSTRLNSSHLEQSRMPSSA